ncbi:MAG: sensor histidine kinase [Bacteroidota bacterium]
MQADHKNMNDETSERVKEILEVVMSYARLDFTKKTGITGSHDMLDAISSGVNMLGEELETSIISLKEKEKLLKEIHHRVKNNLQIVSSLLRLQSEKVLDKKYLDLVMVSQNRITSMALVHEMLYSTQSLGRIEMKEYIERLTQSVYQSFFKPGLSVEFKYDIDRQLFFDIDHLVPIGLILNEIISNSFKYAFPDNKGRISVSLHRSDQTFNLNVNDNGKGLPESFDVERDGHLGLQLIHMLSEQLNGTVEINRKNGVSYNIIFIQP